MEDMKNKENMKITVPSAPAAGHSARSAVIGSTRSARC
jgi:hypothetical protein